MCRSNFYSNFSRFTYREFGLSLNILSVKTANIKSVPIFHWSTLYCGRYPKFWEVLFKHMRTLVMIKLEAFKTKVITVSLHRML
jgi:hypothetical protein